MKKQVILSLLIITFSLLLIGCNDKEKKENNWKIDITENKQKLEEDVEKIISDALSNYNGTLDYVALLAKQVVAGTNYMFLCKDDDSYKIAIVYNDLEGVSQITSVSDFNPINYINENDEPNNGEIVAGGWYIEISERTNNLPNNIKSYFEQATETMTGAVYYPFAVLAHQNKNGTSYAILCYEEGSYIGSTAGVYVLTLNIDKEKTPKIISISSINLAEFNK